MKLNCGLNVNLKELHSKKGCNFFKDKGEDFPFMRGFNYFLV